MEYVASEPETLDRYFYELELPACRIGLEAGPLSHWLHAGLVAVCRDVVLLKARHVKGGTFGDDRKDRSERCPRNCPAAADGLVSADPCKIVGIAGYPRRSRRAQAYTGQAARR